MIAPRDYVEDWLRKHSALIKLESVKWEKSDVHTEFLSVWYESDKYLIDICCWNHACCLNITALNVKTEKYDFCIEGSCDGINDLSDKLSQFLTWLDKNR